jgi:hypothetical protein
VRKALTLPFTCLLAAAAASAGATSPAWARADARKAPIAPAITSQLVVVEKAKQHGLWRPYPDALFELAKRYQSAKLSQLGCDSAEQAAKIYDQQLELHHDLSEAVSDAAHGRAERAAARELGLARDTARFLAAQLAEQVGEPDRAVRNYLLVARSQPGEGLGIDAMAALKDLAWLASPLPQATASEHTP